MDDGQDYTVAVHFYDGGRVIDVYQPPVSPPDLGIVPVDGAIGQKLLEMRLLGPSLRFGNELLVGTPDDLGGGQANQFFSPVVGLQNPTERVQDEDGVVGL